MRRESIESLPDGCVRVCLAGGERSICATVNSHHLVEDKWRQLHTALDKAESSNRFSHVSIRLIDFFTYFKGTPNQKAAIAMLAEVMPTSLMVGDAGWVKSSENRSRSRSLSCLLKQST